MKKYISTVIVLCAVFSLICLPSCGDREYNDDLVYSTQSYFKNGAYFRLGTMQLGCAYFNEPGKAYYACSDPLCSHDYFNCPTFSIEMTSTLTVTPEGRDLPLVYMFGLENPIEYVDGELVEAENASFDRSDVRVFDAETGETSLVAKTEFFNIQGSWYYDGKIYLWAEGCSGKGASCRVGMVDVKTGKVSNIVLGEEDHYRNAAGLGITGGRFYFIDQNGVVYSCDTELSDIREEYDCGITPFLSGRSTTLAYVDHGMLYFERNAHIIEEISEDFVSPNRMAADVYALKLDDIAAGETLVAKDVYKMLPYNGDLYFTVVDYKEYGKNSDGYLVASFDGGTLYRYVRDTGETETCFSDCGISFFNIYDIADGKILFEGMYYREVDPSSGMPRRNYMCVCDIATGKWDVLYHTNTIE